MDHLLIWMTFLLASILTGPLASYGMTRDEQAAKVIGELSSSDVPGIQYVMVNKDRTVLSSCGGLADIRNRIPLGTDHTLSAFSMTKTLTAIAILQLAEKRQIDIDDRLSKFVEHPYNQGITLRQLLDHTSGIPNPIPLRWGSSGSGS